MAYEVRRKVRPENLTPREKVGGLAGKNAMVRRVCRRRLGALEQDRTLELEIAFECGNGGEASKQLMVFPRSSFIVGSSLD